LLKDTPVSDEPKRQKQERREETLRGVNRLFEEEDTDTILFEATQMLSQMFDMFAARLGTDVKHTRVRFRH
jgi:hypothetical protein